jgi:hypothetical protein
MRSYNISLIQPSVAPGVPSSIVLNSSHGNVTSSFHGKEWINTITGVRYSYITYDQDTGTVTPAPPPDVVVLVATTFDLRGNTGPYNGRYTVYTTPAGGAAASVFNAGQTTINLLENLTTGSGTDLTTGYITNISTFYLNAFGETTITIPEQQDVIGRPIEFTGRFTSGWGETVYQNLIKSVQNFAGAAPPSNPFIGQLWFDSSTSVMRMYTLSGTWDSLTSGGGASQSELDALESTVAGHTSTITSLNNAVTAIDTTIPGTFNDGVGDNWAAINAVVSPTGSFFTAGKVNAVFPKGGIYKSSALVDLHPSISLDMGARGGILLLPGNNLPAYVPGTVDINGVGAQAAVIRVLRDTLDSSSTLAWSGTIGGFNIDFRNSAQSNPVHGIRYPNPNPNNNSYDPDPDFLTNKDYVAGRIELMDIIGAKGSGVVVEAGNGRLDVHSARSLNSGLYGWDLGGNDVVMSGHWAAGGSAKFGLKIGLASGFFAVCGNVWGNPLTRSLTSGAVWFNARKTFSFGFSELNDWLRMDGGDSNCGGVIMGLNFHQHAEHFVSDGVALDVTPGGPDSRLQANGGIIEYQSLNLTGNIHTRTDKVTFPTPSNIGGVTAGSAQNPNKYGTAPQYLWDVGGNGAQPAMVNINESYCTVPNVKPWTGNNGTFTVDIPNNKLLSTNHKLLNGYRIGFSTTNTLPSGIVAGTTVYYVIKANTDDFQVSATYGGQAITLGGTPVGVHKWYNLSAGPYNVHNGGIVNYAYQDSYTGLFRVGAIGPTHSHIALGIAETDDTNPNYTVEIGDHSFAAGNVPYRTIMYGMTDFDNAVQYTDGAIARNAFAYSTDPLNPNDPLTVNIKAGTRIRRIVLSGGNWNRVTITLPTDMKAHQPLRVIITGKQIASLAWTVTGTGGLNATILDFPQWSPGSLVVDLWYERDQNSWDCIGVWTQGGQLGRIDTANAPLGVVGEQVSIKIGPAAAVLLPTATTVNITSITLTPGDWTVTSHAFFTTDATTAATPSLLKGAISLSATTLNGTDPTSYASRWYNQGAAPLATDIDTFTMGGNRITVATGTTQVVYLNLRAAYTGGANLIKGWGDLRAIRTT